MLPPPEAPKANQIRGSCVNKYIFDHPPYVPPSLHLYGDHQVTKLIIFNRILLLAALYVI